MPSNQAVWGIEIGQCALKAIRVRHNPETNKVEALAFDYIEHPKILSQPDADPDQLSREAIQSFLSRNTIKGDRVVIGVPGQSGLARFIKLPPVEQSRIPEIVRYEARQQIPFALEEVVWDFQTVGKAEETEGFALETEIGLFAMKRDLIYRYMNPFREVGVEVDIVQMRPLAVYNFAAYDRISHNGKAETEKEAEGDSQREELLETKPQDDEGGFIVLLDMGADNSDLVITDGTRIWQRNLPIGGNHFTRALTKELKLTFAKAEHLKRNATKAQDPRAIFQAMRPVFNDLVSEIQRSIGYFSSVHRQSKIKSILGMGNAFKLPGLQKFLSQNLQYEVEKVEKFNNLSGDAVVTAPAFQENILSFSVVYGLALQGLELSGVRTSLLPPEISQARMIRRKKPWALSAAAMLMAGFTFLFFGNWSQLNAVSSPAFKIPEEKAKTAQSNYNTKKQNFDTAVGQWNEKKKEGELLTKNVEERMQWVEILDMIINNILPSNAPGTDPKDLPKLGAVVISDVFVQYNEDVNTGWFDPMKKTAPWFEYSHLPLDTAEPPSGPGWVFTLYGYHFHAEGQQYTVKSLTGANGFQSALARQIGIRGATLIENKTFPYVPGSDQFATRKRENRPAANRGLGALAGGGGGMGQGMAGGALDSSEDSGPLGRRGAPESEGQGGGLESGQQPAPNLKDLGIVTSIPRTEFMLQFAWLPVKKEARKSVEELQKAILDKGLNPRIGAVPPDVPKSDQPKSGSALDGMSPQGAPSGQPATPPGATTPGAAPPGAAPQNGAPTSAPANPNPSGQPATPLGQPAGAPPGGRR